jgi:luciferase family oxidoreductase group 1
MLPFLKKSKSQFLSAASFLNLYKKQMTIISILDLAMVIEGHTPAETFANSANLAQHAEKWGYNRYWLAEHHNMEGIASTATSILIGYIAAATSTLRVGSGGIMLPNHAPLVIAEQFGTLATLFPDRIDLGLGRAPGTDQLTAMALRRDQRAVMDFEGNIRELQKYLSAANKTGPVRAIPGEGLDIPIWLLGSSTDSAYLAAEMGLPYAFASHFAPAQLMEAIAIYRRHFKPSAQLQVPYAMPCINIIAADSDYEAARLVTSFKKLFLGIITGDRKKMAPPVEPESFMDPLEEAALEQMIKYTFVGGPEKVKKELEAFIKMTGADEIMVSAPVYEHQARLRSHEIVAGLKINCS